MLLLADWLKARASSPCSSPFPRSTWAGPHSPCWTALGLEPWHRTQGHRVGGPCGSETAELQRWTTAGRRTGTLVSLLLPGQLFLQVPARRLSSRTADRKRHSFSHAAKGFRHVPPTQNQVVPTRPKLRGAISLSSQLVMTSQTLVLLVSPRRNATETLMNKPLQTSGR